MKYKIGQEIEITNKFFLNIANGKKVQVNPGDKAMVVKKINENMGEIIYISGNAKGNSQNINIEVDTKIDEEEIASRIMKQI
ncbi:hypothetical protein [Clostridium oceanicum]|uniref:Uncharacterized protein n=1 Tax=Clostridium oceanicum TaxID=1543 RepID=A0ABP3V907_9CLOT